MPVETRPHIEEASDCRKYPLGTRFVDSSFMKYGYGRATTDLRANRRAYAYFPEPAGPPYDSQQLTEGFWSDIRSSCRKGCRLAGIPAIDVSRGQYCWFRTRF